MSYKFGSQSKKRLKTIHEDLQLILVEAIKIVDFTILCGHRTHEEQMKAFNAGRSKLLPPQSKHNQLPSLAVDIAPWPIDWESHKRFYWLAGICKGIAHENNIPLRYGGDWDMDGELLDNSFNDLVHLELI